MRGFAAAQIVVSNTTQIDLANQLSQIKSKGFLGSSKAPEALSVAKVEAVSCVYWRCSRRRSDNRRDMNTTDKVGEENNERIVMDNEMMNYEKNLKVTR